MREWLNKIEQFRPVFARDNNVPLTEKQQKKRVRHWKSHILKCSTLISSVVVPINVVAVVVGRRRASLFAYFFQRAAVGMITCYLVPLSRIQSAFVLHKQ